MRCAWVLFCVLLMGLLLSSCSDGKKTVSGTPQPISTYALTPGERVVRLYGHKEETFGPLAIYTSDSTVAGQVSVGLRAVYPEHENYVEQRFSVYEGQVLEFGGYRLRIFRIIPDAYQGHVIVEAAFFDP